MAERRVACIWLPRFSLENARATQRIATDRPIALYNADSPSREIVAASDELLGRGLRLGLPLTSAETRCPGALYLAADPESDRIACGAIAALFDPFSPAVEIGPVGIFFLDSEGLTLLYGEEPRLAARLRDAVPPMHRVHACVGIADGRAVAEIAARQARGRRDPRAIVPPGENRSYLAPLPLDVLPLAFDDIERLHLLGIRTVADFTTRLPFNAVSHRFGDAGRRAWRIARGTWSGAPIAPRPRPLALHDRIDLDWSEENPDRLTFIVKALADRLAARLLAHGLAAHRLRVTWHLDPRPPERDDGTPGDPFPTARQADLHLPEGGTTAAALLEMLRWHIEGLHLTAPVVAIALEADDLGTPRGVQLRLLDGQLGRPPSFERQRSARRAIARLRARWGNDAVRAVAIEPARRPESAVTWSEPGALPHQESTNSPRPARRSTRRHSRPLVPPTPQPDALLPSPPLWFNDPPEPIEVHPPGERAGPVVRIKKRRLAIAHWAGPFRIVDLPWRENGADRDYYQVVSRGGDALWIFHDRRSDAWYWQGTFD